MTSTGKGLYRRLTDSGSPSNVTVTGSLPILRIGFRYPPRRSGEGRTRAVTSTARAQHQRR
eukprot:3422993-Heterocapsa_arctica.AAC.1